MSDDLLARVRAAKEYALHAYIKESITYDLSLLIFESRDAIISALRKEHGIAVGEDLPDAQERLGKLIRESLSLSRAGYASACSDYEKLLSTYQPKLHSEFIKIRDHFVKAEKLAHQLSQSSSGKERKVGKSISDHLDEICRNGVERGEQKYHKYMEEESNTVVKPEVLVLQGGGAKGMAYSGVIEHLEGRGMLKDIKMVAGTSAGSLMGLPVALGYSSDEINQIVHGGRFAQFFAESTLKFKFLTKILPIFNKKKPSELPFTEASLLDKYASDFFMGELAELSGKTKGYWTKISEHELQSMLKVMESTGDLEQVYRSSMDLFAKHLEDKGRQSELDILRFSALPGRSEAMQAALTCIRLSTRGRHKKETIEEFIGDIIQAKIERVPKAILEGLEPAITTLEEMRNINFSQLKQLADEYPNGGFKEFGVAITDSYLPISLSNGMRSVYRLLKTEYQKISGDIEPDDGTGAYDKNLLFRPVFVRADNGEGKYLDMPIKTAVRASMNLPVVFGAIKYNGGRYIDGGMTNNFPHRMFNDRFSDNEEAKSKTMGFMLSAIENDIEMKALDDLINSRSEYLDIEIEKKIKPKSKAVFEFITHPISSTFGFVMDRISRFLSQRVVNIMSTYNSTMPSIDQMDNVGIISTGVVGTEDFHLPRRDRVRLHYAGTISTISVTSNLSDKYLRYATGRLSSLMAMESKLTKAKEKIPEFRDDLQEMAMSGYEKNWHLGDVLSGRLGRLKKQKSDISTLSPGA